MKNLALPTDEVIKLFVLGKKGETKAYTQSGEWLATFPFYGTAIRNLSIWFPENLIVRAR